MFSLFSSWLAAGAAALVAWASSAPVGPAPASRMPQAMSAETGVAGLKPGMAIQDSLAFEANQGQLPAQVEYFARGNGYGLFLTGNEAVFSLAPKVTDEHDPAQPAVLRMSIVGGDPKATIAGLDKQQAVSHYYAGHDQAKWRSNVSRYGKVRYQDVYPGVDLEYYGKGGELEYDFILDPGRDPDRIEIRFDGVEGMRLDRAGNLVLKTANGDMVQHRPVVYQNIAGKRITIDGAYALRGDDRFGFKLGAYDRSQPLVIDPVLAYGSYLGGNRADFARGVALDPAGNIYVAGITYSLTFPFNRSSATQASASGDALICKLRPDGATVVYCAYLGGDGSDEVTAVATDGQGNAYLTGATNSSNFPVKNVTPPVKVGYDGFLTKLSPTGSMIVFSTLVTGSRVAAIKVDAAGASYLAGETVYNGLGATAGAFDTSQNSPTDAFVAKYSAAGAKLYATYLGGIWDDGAWGIAIDASGCAYVTGYTESEDFPTKGARQPALGGNRDGFLAKFNPSGSALVFSTFHGGAGWDAAGDVAVDPYGRAYVLGAGDLDIPEVSPLPWWGFPPSSGGFISAFNPAGNELFFYSHVRASVEQLELDNSGNVIVAGVSHSGSIPVVGGRAFSEEEGRNDVYVAKFNPANGKLLYSTYYGANWSEAGTGDTHVDNDSPSGVAVNAWGDIVLVGKVEGDNLPLANPLQAANATPVSEGSDREDFFVSRFSPAQSAWRGDFNGDGKSDVFFRNRATGANAIWYSANSATSVVITARTDQNWQVAGVGDFNGDNRDDLLWRNPANGQNSIWYSGNSSSSAQLANVLGSNWRIGAVGDFDGDHRDDILWHNTSTAANGIWRSGNSATQQAMTSVTNLAWEIVGAGDFNGDRKSDVVWRNSSTGQNAIWLSANSRSPLAVTTLSDPEWRIAGTADYNGDGKADLFWRHVRTGRNVIWRGGSSAASQAVSTLPTQWELAGQGDYNGDGKADILWHNKATGANAVWRSARSSTGQALTTVSNLDWYARL